MDLPTAVRRLEPTLRGFLACELTFNEFSDRFLARYREDMELYSWDTQGVLGPFFTDWDQTAEDPDPEFFETTVDEFRPKVAQLLADALGTTDR